ncbi:hypothetical protein TWF730_004288 [Orbilia blumenaviensis]|uniref:Uncharacterized protein n=1 Tax=Orbilia blumenaviensis TaxID=1796055 RepID=A0AAV9U2E2_9PEZI
MWLILLAVVLATPAYGAAGGDTDGWDDFANNFATDIAPIVVLFGEQVTKQFLSESTSTLDHIIFAVAPLGVLTAVVSVIRVCGNSSLKAFIGRAQEAHGVSEAELCSSTSRDVCELWSNGGISRIFGRPKVLEFVFSGTKDFYMKFRGGDIKHPSCGIHTSKAFFCPKEFSDCNDSGSQPGHIHEIDDQDATLKVGDWGEVKGAGSPDPTKSASNQGNEKGTEQRFAPHPNLSLNVGMRPPPRWVQWAVAAFGVIIQLSFFGYATWAAYYAPHIWEDGKPPQKWAFPLAAVGTGHLVIGMGLCAMLIDRRTHERRFVQSRNLSQGTTMFWLQPGDQSIGDQVFNSFAHWEQKDKYVTSWRIDDPTKLNSPLVVWPAITFSTLGFILQFIGLRGLHGSVALYQLAATLIMAFIRATLRSKRIGEGKNRLKDRRDVEGHELDWTALQIDAAVQENKPGAGSNNPPVDTRDTDSDCIWYIVDLKPTHPPESSGVSVAAAAEVNILEPKTKTWQNIIGFSRKSDSGSTDYSCVQTAVEWIKLHEIDHPASLRQPNKAARTLYYRCRLGRLTDSVTSRQERPWDTQVRAIATKLKQAIETTAKHIFSREVRVSSGWENVEAVVWSSTCRLDALQKQSGDCLPIHFLLYREKGLWKINKHQLEAVLGLWQWSLKQQSNQKDYFSKKLFLEAENAKMEELKSSMRLWVTQVLPISDNYTSTTSQASINTAPQTGTYSSPQVQLPRFQPLLSVIASTLQMETTGRGILSIPSTVSPLELMAQDIFTIFISRITDILEPLKNIEPRTRRAQEGIIDLGASSNKTFLGLTEPNIEILVENFIAAGLGSREDALVCLIPSLLYKQKLPVSKEIIGRLLQAAKLQRRAGEFQKCEDILKGLLQINDPTIEPLVVGQLGELYRHSSRSPKDQDQEFGRRIGAELILMVNISPEAQKIQECYKGVVEFVSNIHRGNSTQTSFKTDKVFESLEALDQSLHAENLVSVPAENPKLQSLLLTTKYNTSSLPFEQIKEILEWAIVEGFSELIEDLWSDIGGLHFQQLWHAPHDQKTPLFWALEMDCRPETFQSLIEWPGAKIEWSDANGTTALLEAVHRQSILPLKALLKVGADTNARKSDGSNALHIAAIGGNREIFELLLAKGTDPSARMHEGDRRTPIGIALLHGHSQLVKLLLDRGADFSEVSEALFGEVVRFGYYEMVELLVDNGTSTTAINRGLGIAASEGHLTLIEFLLSRGADANHGFKEAIDRVSMGKNDIGILDQFFKSGIDIDPRYGWGGWAISNNLLQAALQQAVSQNCLHLIDFLLKRGADINASAEGSETMLRIAVGLGQKKLVELLLDNGAEINATSTNIPPGTALHLATARGNEEMVRILLNRGADINASAEGSETMLRIAVGLRQKKLVELLLDNGAEINATSTNIPPGTALHLATARGNEEMVRILLNRGADIDTEDKYNRTALQVAIGNETNNMVEILLNEGADVNAQNKNHGNALQAAAFKGNKELVELLLNKGANVNAQGGEYGNALQAAAFRGNKKTVELLLNKGANVNAQGGEYGNALQAAAFKGNKETIELLLNKGADINAQGGYYGNALQAAANCSENEEVVELLLNKGANINAQGGYYGNALQAAASCSENEEIIEFLLNKGADINAQGEEYENALQAAGFKRNIKTIKLLLNKGADINAQGGEYGNALQAAANGCKNKEVVELLLNKGADVNVQGGHYGSALKAAVCGYENKEVVELLLNKGADVNVQGGHYGSALQAAVCGYKNKEVVELLLNKGADVKVQGGHYGSALQAAVCGYQNKEVVELLLNKGADVNVQGGHYGSALQAAAASREDALVELLLQRGATINARGGKYGTALNAAVCFDRLSTARTLLDNGAEPVGKRDGKEVYIHKKIIDAIKRMPCVDCQAERLQTCDAALESCELHSLYEDGMRLDPSQWETDSNA